MAPVTLNILGSPVRDRPMSEGEDNGDKQFEPTQKKLDDARLKGEVPRSADLTTAVAYGGFVVIATSVGSFLIMGLASDLRGLLSNADEISADFFEGGSQAQFGHAFTSTAAWVAPWFVVPALGVILAIIVQGAFIVTPSKLTPKLNRISLISNAKNKFGRRGLFEFFKSFTKLLVYSAILGAFLLRRAPEIVTTVTLSPSLISVALLEMSLSFLVIVLVVSASIGVLDTFWQRAEHTRKNRMSRKDLVDESKQSEGDPHMKQQRRQRGMEIAANRMLADVPGSDVVIVNPEHYAVALKWSRAPGTAPQCVAKGKGEVAARIREIANENAIPLHRDPPTARALFAAVRVGDQIQPEFFKAVAASIRFAEDMRRLSKSKVWTK